MRMTFTSHNGGLVILLAKQIWNGYVFGMTLFYELIYTLLALLDTLNFLPPFTQFLHFHV